MPKGEHQGYFSVINWERTSATKRAVTLVATTRCLQHRWFATPVGAIDGGRKFTIMGWPVHVWGAINNKHEVCPTAIGLTSTSHKERVVSMLQEWERTAATVVSASKRSKKEFGMCDAEDAYRAALAASVGTDNVMMCFFHVKEAVKAWVEAHGRFGSLDERRLLWKREIEPAYDILHMSTSANDFHARCLTFVSHWQAVGVAAATTWTDRAGVVHDIVSYSRAEWFPKVWDFRHKRVLPTTNNSIESTMHPPAARSDSGILRCPPSSKYAPSRTLILQHVSHLHYMPSSKLFGLQRKRSAAWPASSRRRPSSLRAPPPPL